MTVKLLARLSGGRSAQAGPRVRVPAPTPAPAGWRHRRRLIRRRTDQVFGAGVSRAITAHIAFFRQTLPAGGGAGRHKAMYDLRARRPRGLHPVAKQKRCGAGRPSMRRAGAAARSYTGCPHHGPRGQAGDLARGPARGGQRPAPVIVAGPGGDWGSNAKLIAPTAARPARAHHQLKLGAQAEPSAFDPGPSGRGRRAERAAVHARCRRASCSPGQRVHDILRQRRLRHRAGAPDGAFRSAA